MNAVVRRLLSKNRHFLKLKAYLDVYYQRDNWLSKQLHQIPSGKSILDAGCGDQKYRKYCNHLNYFGQDFAEFSSDKRLIIGQNNLPRGEQGYQYGVLDYVSDICAIPEVDASFDCILCSEVLEHIPYPSDAIKELSRLIADHGTLIITAPSNCLRHMDPYFFFSGFSDNWFKKILEDADFENIEIEPVGDYYRWLAVEMYRVMGNSVLSRIVLLPAFLYFALKRKSKISVDTLCIGYHVTATRRPR